MVYFNIVYGNKSWQILHVGYYNTVFQISQKGNSWPHILLCPLSPYFVLSDAVFVPVTENRPNSNKISEIVK